MAFIIGLRVPIKVYERIAFIGYAIACLLLAITLIPSVGIKIGGAQRWLNLFGFQFQPVEFMKFWWAISVSLVLTNKKNQLNKFLNGIVPVVLVMVVPIGLLMMQPDLGNSILTLMVAFSLLILSPLPLSFLIINGCIGIGVVVGSVMTHPYQMARIQSFLNPWMDPLGINYHIIQYLQRLDQVVFLGLDWENLA